MISMNIIIVTIKLDFRNTMRAGDQKLMIDLEWPNIHKVTAVAKKHLFLDLTLACMQHFVRN